jgi:hypothetical protein
VAVTAHVIFHYHIFKNAGSTVDWALRRHFGARFETFDGKTPWTTMTPQTVLEHLRSRPRVSAFASHQAKFPALQDKTLRVYPLVFLRHPIDRVGSVYAFERRQREDTPGSLRARSSDFAGYVRWRLDNRGATVLTDHQTACCTPWKPTGPASRGRHYADLAEAMETVRTCAVAGVVERLDESLVLAEQSLSGAFPGIDLSYVRQNISRSDAASLEARADRVLAELGPELAEEVVRRNRRDLELYRAVTEELQRRVDSLPDFAARLDDFRRRCEKHEGRAGRALSNA